MFFAVANLLNVDVILFDTTSTYIETDPDVGEGGTTGFRRWGHSKDHRQDPIDYLTGELDRIAAARARTSTALKTTASEKAKARLEAQLAGHTRAECAQRTTRVRAGGCARRALAGR